MILEYPLQIGGLCTYAGPLSYEMDLGTSGNSQEFAPTAAKQIREDLARLGVIIDEPSSNPDDYPPTEPISKDSTLDKYLERAQAAPRVMARWAAYNEEKLLSGEWPADKFAVFMQKVGPVVILLNSLAFGAAAAAVNNFVDELATPEAKAAYIQAMSEEGALV